MPWSLPWHHLISLHRYSHLLSPAFPKFTNFSFFAPLKSRKGFQQLPNSDHLHNSKANLSYVVNNGIIFRHEQGDDWFGAWDHHLLDLLTAARVLKQGTVRDCKKKQGLTFVSVVLMCLHHWTRRTKPRRRETQQHGCSMAMVYTWPQETSLPPVNG